MEPAERKTYNVTLLAAMVLVHALTKGAQHKKVGFADTENTLGELRTRLGAMGKFRLPKSVLESLLWSANLLDEQGAFWHPDRKTFDQFLEDVLDEGETFDKFCNTIESSKRNKGSTTKNGGNA